MSDDPQDGRQATMSIATAEPEPGGGAAFAPSYVFALGQIVPRFPTVSVEREFAQAVGRGDTEGLTDAQARHRVLSARENRYLVRQLCWTFVIEGLENYVLLPKDPGDYELLAEAVRAEPDRNDLDVVIGQLGPAAPPQVCGGLTLPIVFFDQLYSFDRDSLLSAIPRPEGEDAPSEEQFHATAGELFDRIMQVADNAGVTGEHRALNYLASRYDAVYTQTARAHAGNASLSSVDVRRSRLAGVRDIVDVVFTYTHRTTDVVDKYFVRVDVTEEFPFLVTKLSPFYER
ncbi:hypothetical protein AB0F81_40340 [Actinoplanes sp. NPDC024001]|uniref:cyanobactin maturation protease PatG family protein n=1 Tax=Actinoplanes sp. NPDC024001 TaxID=3154598 RepID=UPI003400374D